jgi:C-terminal processing protease CtpA/Prc
MKKALMTLVAVALLTLPGAAVAQTPPDAKAKAEAERQVEEARKQMEVARKQMRDAERQMRDAERQIRDAARQIGDAQGELMSHEREIKLKAKLSRLGQLRTRVVVFGERPRLGLVLRTEADPKADAAGAAVDAVSPGSPAEDAGLKAGDVITSVNGKSLLQGDVDVDEDESAPAARLVELASKLKDGEAVTVEYRRGATTGKATLTARRLASPVVRVFNDPDIDIPDIPDIPEIADIPDIPEIDLHWEGMGSHGWLDLDLAGMSPDLGEYFGAKEGVLVVRAPKDDALTLKAGDVILKIGERAVSSPGQAMRVLRSFEPGEKVSLEVLRNHKAVTLQASLPEGHAGRHMRHAPPAPPAAEAPPAAPAPAAKPHGSANDDV